jgi:hypothetical protein
MHRTSDTCAFRDVAKRHWQATFESPRNLKEDSRAEMTLSGNHDYH